MIEINLKQFPTHLPYTKNKKVVDKYTKLNFQSIYNGSINRFSRANLMDALHSYVERRLPKNINVDKFPVKLHYVFKTVINHGDISLRNFKIIWKKPDEHYIAGWDIENLASLWVKGATDSIVRKGILPDDSVRYLTGISYEFIPVEEFEDREIIIKIIEQ